MDVDRTALEHLAVQSRNGFVSLRIGHLDEGESAGQACIPVHHQLEIVNGSDRFEEGAERLRCRLQIQVANINVLHGISLVQPLAAGRKWSGVIWTANFS